MSKFKPEQGEKILVMNELGVWADGTRVFIALHKGLYLCEHKDDDARFVLWSDVKPLPTEPEPVEYDHETWPRQVIWLRKGHWTGGESMLVVGVSIRGVAIAVDSAVISFCELATSAEMSLDFCKTWKPCHYVPTEG